MDHRFSTSPRGTAQYRKNNNNNQVRSPHRDVVNNNNHDQRSMGSGSAANCSSAAPNSVYLPCSMSRDLSDLSGSYVNERTRGTQGNVPRHIYDHASYKGPWRQAYALSQIPPNNNQKENWAFQSTDATILVSQNDVVEIVDSPHLVKHKQQVPVPVPGGSAFVSSTSLSSYNKNKNGQHHHSRIPLLVLLMDATTHSYEIMQVWVDRSSDSVRELVQCMRQSIPTTKHWKQDYDGLFQVRGNRFTQLIHILRLLKYDIQPHEILIAKPRTMTAKVTISCATSAIRHLTNIGMINTDSNDHRRLFRPKSEESPLLLSKRARDRIYEPDGFFSHHHAVQYLTFCPPFENQGYKNNNKTTVGEMPFNVMTTTTTTSSDKDSLANSSLGSHSVVSGSGATSELSPFGKGGVQILNALGISNRTNSVAQAPPGDGGSSSKSSKSNEQGAGGGGSTPSTTRNTATTVIPSSSAASQMVNNSISSDDMNIQEGRMMRRSFVGGVVSKLKCCKSKDSVARNHHQQHQQGAGSVATFSRTPFATLSEEQEMQWSNGVVGFDIRPIAEDQTTISGRSTVSMSAPLLAPSTAVQLSENAFEI